MRSTSRWMPSSNHYSVAAMTNRKSMKHLTEDEIDRIVIDEADKRSAWEKPVHVKRPKGCSLTIPSDLAARASFLARLPGSSGLDEWVTHVLRERVELEEGAFSEARRDLSARKTPDKSLRRTVRSRR